MLWCLGTSMCCTPRHTATTRTSRPKPSWTLIGGFIPEQRTRHKADLGSLEITHRNKTVRVEQAGQKHVPREGRQGLKESLYSYSSSSETAAELGGINQRYFEPSMKRYKVAVGVQGGAFEGEQWKCIPVLEYAFIHIAGWLADLAWI